MSQKTPAEKVSNLIKKIEECVRTNNLKAIPKLMHELEKLKGQK
jgi:hypothetical protein